jgi:hypothetical protein
MGIPAMLVPASCGVIEADADLLPCGSIDGTLYALLANARPCSGFLDELFLL